jgi:hypothetical protein
MHGKWGLRRYLSTRYSVPWVQYVPNEAYLPAIQSRGRVPHTRATTRANSYITLARGAKVGTAQGLGNAPTCVNEDHHGEAGD